MGDAIRETEHVARQPRCEHSVAKWARRRADHVRSGKRPAGGQYRPPRDGIEPSGLSRCSGALLQLDERPRGVGRRYRIWRCLVGEDIGDWRRRPVHAVTHRCPFAGVNKQREQFI